MATIAELVLKLRGDNTELREMFTDSAQRAIGMTTIITDAMEMAGKNAARQAGMGALAAKTFIESMENTLKNDLQRIKEDQYALLITPAEAEIRAGQAALAYNDTLLQTLANLRASGNITATIEGQLVGALQKAGLKAGVALQEGVADGIKAGQSVVAAAAQRAAQSTFTPYTEQAEKGLARTNLAITNQGGAWTTMGRRGATSLMGLGFGIESFVNGTEAGMRRALRSVESFAIFFGPEGLLVAGIITAGLAIYDHFHKIEKQIDEALKHAVSAASQAANALDQIGLEKAMRDIQQGQATSVDPSGIMVINKRSEFAVNAFEGSGADLEARIADTNRRIALATKAGQVSLVGTLTHDLNDLEAKIKPLRERYSQIYELLTNPAPQMRMPEAPKPIEIKGKSPEEYAAEATKLYYQNLGLLIERLGAAQTAHQAYADVLMKLLDAQSKLGGTNALVTGTALPGEKPEDLKRRLDMIKEIGKALADIGPKINIKIPGFDASKIIDNIIPDIMDKLNKPTAGPMGEQMTAFDHLVEQIQIYRNNIELTNMDLKAHGEAIVDIDKQLGPLRDSAVAMAVELRKALRAAGLDPAVVDLLVQHWIEGLKKIGAAGEETAGRLAKIAGVMDQIGQIASAASGLNDALRGQANTSAFLGSVGQAGSSIGAAVAEGGMNPVADIQALTDTLNVGNALTASTREIALEHKEILKQNNERLAEVSMRLVGFAVSAGTSGQAGGALQAFFANASALAKLASGATHTSGLFGTGKSGDLQTQIDALMPFLKQAGLTFDQFKKIALDNGFSILDKEGRLVTDALQQMKDHLQDVIRSLFTFQNTLSDQKSLSDLAQKLSGAPETPQDAVNRNLALIQKLAPHLLPGAASAIGGENQDALRKMLQDLLQKLVSGQINPADLGGFQNLQELISIIDATAGSLNELRNVTNGVTAALTNIPTGFKLALLEFDAQDAMTRAQAGGTYGLTPTNPNPLGSGGVTFNVQAGAIAIDPTNKNAAEIGQETLNALQALAGQRLGNRARWAGMN